MPSRPTRALRRALTLLAVLGLLWSAAWFVAARSLERGIETWFAEHEAAGMVARYTVLDLTGYPLRLALRLEAPEIADPFEGVGWAAEALTLRSGAFRPDRIAVTPEGVQRLLTPMGAATLEGDLRGALRLGGLALAPRGGRVTGRDLRLMPPEGGWQGLAPSPAPAATPAGGGAAGGLADAVLRLAELDAGLAAAGRSGDRLALEVVLGGLTLDAGGDSGPATVEAVRLGGMLVLRDPDDGAPPDLIGIDDLQLSLRSGEGRLEGAGRIGTDAAGLAEGRIELSLSGWNAFVDLAVALGAVDPEALRGWGGMLAALGRNGALQLPLVMEQGRMRLGPVPLGPAPRLGPPG